MAEKTFTQAELAKYNGVDGAQRTWPLTARCTT